MKIITTSVTKIEFTEDEIEKMVSAALSCPIPPGSVPDECVKLNRHITSFNRPLTDSEIRTINLGFMGTNYLDATQMRYLIKTILKSLNIIKYEQVEEDMRV